MFTLILLIILILMLSTAHPTDDNTPSHDKKTNAADPGIALSVLGIMLILILVSATFISFII